MKKKMFVSIIIAMFVTITLAFAYITDHSDTGWIPSNGLNTVDGRASNVHYIPGGYGFYCDDSYLEICYTINGPDLWINGNISLNSGGDIEIHRK